MSETTDAPTRPINLTLNLTPWEMAAVEAVAEATGNPT